MQSWVNTATIILAMTTPLYLLVTGLIPTAWANARPRLMASLNMGAAWLALLSAILVAGLYSYDGSLSWSLYSLQLPADLGNFSISTYINTVTVIMLLLVSFVGVIVSRYSRNYLDGETRQGQFHKWLSLTLAAILTLIISGNLLMFALAWIATSLFLHQLLMFYRERPAAVLAAHKKFVASRIGDACLLGSVFLINSALGTLQFDAMFQSMSGFQGELPLSLHWAAILIVTAAALKSAQFPFHGWLIQVMEAPTPVSALLHAGIVNAGAFLVIRMSPVVSYSEFALGLLAVVGLITLALASLVMLTQTSVKVSLAWSTTAQMGFMLLEAGLGLYSLAMLHLVAHSLYKAHAFLASGSVVEGFRAPTLDLHSEPAPAWRKSAAFAIAILMTLAMGKLFGIHVAEQPALLAAGAIVAVAMTQLMLQALSLQSSARFLSRALVINLIVCGAYFTLHHGFELALVGSVMPVPNGAGKFDYFMVALIITVFIALLLVQQALKSGRSTLRDALYIHLYNGFYIDVFITRVLQRVWPTPATERNSYGAQL
ncbi:MAG: NADH-quinone oxidoreductase subunit L [Gammaproteobacteria bacterium]|nr:NADH-quinone oxidoreductase subunit L [Gammaproteobacteria bacterium]